VSDTSLTGVRLRGLAQQPVPHVRAVRLAALAFGDHIFDNYVKLKRNEWDD
jgi:glutamine synthetase